MMQETQVIDFWLDEFTNFADDSNELRKFTDAAQKPAVEMEDDAVTMQREQLAAVSREGIADDGLGLAQEDIQVPQVSNAADYNSAGKDTDAWD